MYGRWHIDTHITGKEIPDRSAVLRMECNTAEAAQLARSLISEKHAENPAIDQQAPRWVCMARYGNEADTGEGLFQELLELKERLAPLVEWADVIAAWHEASHRRQNK